MMPSVCRVIATPAALTGIAGTRRSTTISAAKAATRATSRPAPAPAGGPAAGRRAGRRQGRGSRRERYCPAGAVRSSSRADLPLPPLPPRMISVSDVELRAGARLLVSGATFRVGDGDRVGLVGRNGAGKTTLTKVIAGEAAPAAGTVTRTGSIGYLPQDPRTGDLDQLARARILAARGMDTVAARLRKAERDMAEGDEASASRPWPAGPAPTRSSTPSAAGPRSPRPSGSPATSASTSACSASRSGRCPAASAAGSSSPASSSPARTPCCSTSRRTTSTPTPSSGCASACRRGPAGSSSSATTPRCSRRPSPRSSTSTPPARCSTCTPWAGRPTSPSASRTSAAASASARTPRRRRRTCTPRP